MPINPGTDVALALGMMHVIISEKLYDADYVARYTVGFDQLRERVQEYPPERVAKWTGISAADICKLAREYATTRPAVIRLNYGVQRSENGGMATRADRHAAVHHRDRGRKLAADCSFPPAAPIGSIARPWSAPI